MNLVHITIATEGRRALARDEAERRLLVRDLASVAGSRQLAFNLADEHLHSAGGAAQPGRLADGLHRVLRARRPDLVIEPPHLKPIRSRSHLLSVVRYLLQQTDRHGVLGGTVPLAAWSGSCVQDLLLVRLLPGFHAGPLLTELPRLRQREVLEMVGLPQERIEPASDDDLARAGVAQIAALAAGVHVVGPSLVGRSVAVVQARALAVHVARLAGLPTRSLVPYLGVRLRAIEYLMHREVDPRAVLALRRRLALEHRIVADALRRRAM